MTMNLTLVHDIKPTEAKQISSLSSFIYFLKKDKTFVQRQYYFENKKAQILHIRLRTGYRSLNLDMFLKNIPDSPLCNCGSMEVAQHFFFYCRFYQRHRYVLLNPIRSHQTPSLDIILHGDDSLSVDLKPTHICPCS